MVRNFEVSSNKTRGSHGRVHVSSIAFSAMSRSIFHVWMDFVIIALAHLSDNITHFQTVWDHNYGCYRYNFCAFQAIPRVLLILQFCLMH
jgi:hypothetical protein